MISPIESLASALKLSDDPRVVTTGTAPHQIVHTNKAWSELTGFKYVEVVNRTNGFLKGPATDTESIRSLVEAVERGESHQVCVVNYNKEGQPFYNTISCHPLRDSNGVLTHYCGVLQGERVPEGEIPPITRDPLPLRESDLDALQICDPGCSGVVKHEVDAPAALHRPKRRRNDLTLSEALNNQHDAVVLTDSNPPYAITHVNQRWSEMCGYTLEEVEGHTNRILQGPDTDQELVEEMMARVRRGESASATLVNYKKGGERFVNQVQVTPVFNADEEVEQFMALLHEVEVGGAF
mmetsp:Transcript_40342/g.91376  ORF Transcript_40342/g.91376 Transcript_40342/m.91376 type:complete len:295 (-) Transcript_40342:723-1607(-)